jgi:hypothetical protein
MNTKYILFAAAGLTVACFGGPAVEINQDPDIPATRWQGSITSPPNLAGAVQMDGTAWMASGDETNETRVHIEIANASPGGTHPWEVQRADADRTVMRSETRTTSSQSKWMTTARRRSRPRFR